MSSQEYIVSLSSSELDNTSFEELLHVAADTSEVNVKKVKSRYVLIEASEAGVQELRNRCGHDYRIDINRDLRMQNQPR